MSGCLQFVIYCIETNVLIPSIIKFVKTSIYMTGTKKAKAKQSERKDGEKYKAATKRYA